MHLPLFSQEHSMEKYKEINHPSNTLELSFSFLNDHIMFCLRLLLLKK